jgi:hypothetical protein
MKQFVLQPFIFKGKPVVTGQEIDVDDDRLDYFVSQGLVGDDKPVVETAPITEEAPEGAEAEEPKKPAAKPGKSGKKK